jgi:hypothetical protein
MLCIVATQELKDELDLNTKSNKRKVKLFYTSIYVQGWTHLNEALMQQAWQAMAILMNNNNMTMYVSNDNQEGDKFRDCTYNKINNEKKLIKRKQSKQINMKFTWNNQV